MRISILHCMMRTNNRNESFYVFWLSNLLTCLVFLWIFDILQDNILVPLIKLINHIKMGSFSHLTFIFSLKAILTVLFPRSESLLQKRWACTNETFVQPIIKSKKRAQRQLIDWFDTAMSSLKIKGFNDQSVCNVFTSKCCIRIGMNWNEPSVFLMEFCNAFAK